MMFSNAFRHRGAAALIAGAALALPATAVAQDTTATAPTTPATGDTTPPTGDTTTPVAPPTQTTPVVGQTGDEQPTGDTGTTTKPKNDESGVLGDRDSGTAPAGGAAPATAAAAPTTGQGSQSPGTLADTATPVALASTGEDRRPQVIALMLGGSLLLFGALALWPGLRLPSRRR